MRIIRSYLLLFHIKHEHSPFGLFTFGTHRTPLEQIHKTFLSAKFMNEIVEIFIE